MTHHNRSKRNHSLTPPEAFGACDTPFSLSASDHLDAMTYLGIDLTRRFKSLRKSSSSCASSRTSIDTCRSEASFASFPTDPLTKAPIQPLVKKQVACSPSWGLIVALNQSDNQPGLPDEERLQEFVRRSSLYNSDQEELKPDTFNPAPAENPFEVPDAKNSASSSYKLKEDKPIKNGVDTNGETKVGNDGRDLSLTTTSQKLRRLSHRASFSALSDRYTWLKSQSASAATPACGKHEYTRIERDESY